MGHSSATERVSGRGQRMVGRPHRAVKGCWRHLRGRRSCSKSAAQGAVQCVHATVHTCECTQSCVHVSMHRGNSHTKALTQRSGPWSSSDHVSLSLAAAPDWPSHLSKDRGVPALGRRPHRHALYCHRQGGWQGQEALTAQTTPRGEGQEGRPPPWGLGGRHRAGNTTRFRQRSVSARPAGSMDSLSERFCKTTTKLNRL